MPILKDYHHFNGRHPETGSVHNILAYQGVTAPHTGQPYSEAFLLGASGGVAFGYFTFDYEGYPPILSLLTRNTFDPLQTMLERLGIVQNVKQTNRASTAEENLLEVLSNGRPALVWADIFSLPYHGLPTAGENWDMQPVTVYGVEDGIAYLADRSEQPITVPADTLTAARARIKKDKFRLVSLDPPDERKLAAAVKQGIWQCIQLFTEKPPKGTRENFGLAALEKWAKMLVNTRNPQSWERFFPAGSRMFSALAGGAYLPGAYGWIMHWGTQPGADRSTYADFLDEAALLLEMPGLRLASQAFRESSRLWQNLAVALLPEEIPVLGEARHLKDRRYRLFIEKGSTAEQEIREINNRLENLRTEAGTDFPFSNQATVQLRSDLKEHIMGIYQKEKEALEKLGNAMSLSDNAKPQIRDGN